MQSDIQNTKYLQGTNYESFKSKDGHFRMNHTSTLFSHYIITFGGINFFKLLPSNNQVIDEISVFDIETDSFIEPEWSGAIPKGRIEHSACLVDDNKIVIFGGSDNEGKIVKELLVLHLAAEENSDKKTLFIKCEILETTGAEDLFTSGHSADYFDGFMYVFGGLAPGIGSLNQLRRLNLGTRTWEICSANKKTQGRHSHGSAILGDTLYIVGGIYHRGLNDVWSCNLRTMKWSSLGSYLTKYGIFNFCMGVYQDKIYLYGGVRDGAQYRRNLDCFDSRKGKWKAMKIDNLNSSAGRSEHSMIVYKNRLIVWGGRQYLGPNRELNVETDIFQIVIGEEKKEPSKSFWARLCS